MLYEFEQDDARRFVSVVPYGWDRSGDVAVKVADELFSI
jgi:hypothetical protein